MTQLTDISSPNWQPELGGDGVVQDFDDLHQAIHIILRTPKGNDPLRPEFGSNLHLYVDSPIDRARPHIVRETVEAIRRWEPRVSVDTVALTLSEDGRAHLLISWRPADGFLQHTEVVL